MSVVIRESGPASPADGGGSQHLKDSRRPEAPLALKLATPRATPLFFVAQRNALNATRIIKNDRVELIDVAELARDLGQPDLTRPMADCGGPNPHRANSPCTPQRDHLGELALPAKDACGLKELLNATAGSGAAGGNLPERFR